MAGNPAAYGTLAEDSPHVVAATNVRRGSTPAVWKDGQADGYAGQWNAVVPGGPAGRDDGAADGTFEDGPGRWVQI